MIGNLAISMTKNEMINNPNTITKSGTNIFMEFMIEGDDISMIDQFVTGSSSANLVPDKARIANKYNDDEQHIK
eukprot:11712566-Heterocapsa_arctica.AAC.1